MSLMGLLKFYLIFIISILLIGCIDNELPAGIRAGGIKFPTSDQNEIFIKMLKEENIPYELNTHGFIGFLLIDQARVHGISRRVTSGEKLDPTISESLILESIYLQKIYAREFHNNNIPFTTSTNNGNKYLEWNQQYGPQVDVIRQKIDLEMYHSIVSGDIKSSGSK